MKTLNFSFATKLTFDLLNWKISYKSHIKRCKHYLLTAFLLNIPLTEYHSLMIAYR